MAFGRCEVVRISRNVDVKDYELRSYNFPIGNYSGSGFVLDLPEGVNFILTTISIFTNTALYNKPAQGRLDALMWALLRGYALDIKVEDSKGDIFFPANNLPLDLFVSPKADNSVTSAEVFNVVDFLGTPILLSPENTNVILVKQLFEDIYKEIVVPILPLVPDDVRYQMFLQANRLLFDRLQLCLNGFYIKNPDVLLVREDSIDVNVNTLRFTYSKEITPVLMDIQCGEGDEEGSADAVTQKFVFPEKSNIRYSTYEFGIKRLSCRFYADNQERFSPLVTGYISRRAWILDITLPLSNRDYLIRDLEIVFTQIPPLLVVGGRPWAIPNVASSQDFISYWWRSDILGTGILSGTSYIMKDLYWFIPDEIKNRLEKLNAQVENDSSFKYHTYLLYSPYTPATYTKPQPSKKLGGIVEIISGNKKESFYVPNALKIVGDDVFVAKNSIDVFIDQKLAFYEANATYYDKYKVTSLNGQNCNSNNYNSDAIVYIEEPHLISELNNFLDQQNYGQGESFREDFYITKYKMTPSVFPELGVSYPKAEQTSEGFAFVIPAGTMVRFRIKVPLENNFGRGILFLNAFAIEE